MKVLLVNGSPRKNGNTSLALAEIARTLEAEGVQTEGFWIGNKPVRGCQACYTCEAKSLGRCVFDDDVCNQLVERIADADAFVFGTPTYFGQPAGALLTVLQRAFLSARPHFAGKPVACVAVCRRGGSTATFQCMNMPFEMINCLLVGSQYWNVVFGCAEGETAKDTEGLQTMRTLARNMAWVLKNLHRDGAVPYPTQEAWQPTNFIR